MTTDLVLLPSRLSTQTDDWFLDSAKYLVEYGEGIVGDVNELTWRETTKNWRFDPIRIGYFIRIPERGHIYDGNGSFFCHNSLIPVNSWVDIGMNQDVFAEVRRHKESSDKYKSENYNVLEAVDEIIRSKKGVSTYLPSPVEYFSCLMSTLTQDTDRRRSVWFFFHVLTFSCYISSKSFYQVFLTMSSV